MRCSPGTRAWTGQCLLRRWRLTVCGAVAAAAQTLLEQMKGMYNKAGTIPLDKIPPTIGLNGTYRCLM